MAPRNNMSLHAMKLSTGAVMDRIFIYY